MENVMNNYRVLMCDDVNGQVFSFAINVYCVGLFGAERVARDEFPSADIIKIDQITPYEELP